MTDASEHVSSERLEWPIVILAACFHADGDVRARLRDRCEDALAELGTRYGDDEVREYLQAQPGTPLEPLVWTKCRLDLAVLLVRIFFSTTVGATRLRIASTEAQENELGLVLTDNLQSFFTEHYVFGKRRKAPATSAALHPGRLPRSAGAKPFWAGSPWSKPGPPCLLSDENGIEVILPWYELDSVTDTVSRFQEHSRIRGCDWTFSELGLRIEAESPHLKVLTGSPEAQTRFMAHAMKGDILELRGNGDAPCGYEVELTAPGGETTVLHSVVTADGLYSPWLDCRTDVPLSIPDEDKLAIAAWHPPPSTWHGALRKIKR